MTTTCAGSYNASSYNVYRGPNASGPFTEIAAGVGTTYTDSQAPGGTDYYYMTASNGLTESLPSSVVSVSVTPNPLAITSEPVSQANPVGGNVSFNVVATGYPVLTYQWQAGPPGGPYTNLVNGGNVSGVNTNVLAITSLTTNQALSYVVIVTNSSQGAVTSAPPATLTVIYPPAIMTPPASQTNLTGATVAFGVTATGTAPLSYQWQAGTGGSFTNLGNGGIISGAASNILTLTGVTPNWALSYQVIVTNPAGSVTSSPVATLTVHAPPSITVPPASQTVLSGQTVSFTVIAAGDPTLAYQWQANGGTGYTNLTDGGQISGSAANVLTLSNVSSNQALTYQVIVTNRSGSVTASPASLTVLPASFLLNVQYRGSASNPNGPYGLGPGAAYSGAAVLGSAGDAWNQESIGYYYNGSPNPFFNGVSLVNSANSPLGLTLTLGFQSIVQGAALAGTATDAGPTNLMQSSVFIFTWTSGAGAGNALTTHAIGGLSNYAGSTANLVVYAGAPSPQPEQIAITSGATGGNSGSTLTTSSTSRQISAGPGVAYNIFTNLILTGSNLVFTVNEPSAAANANAGYVNGFQLQVVAPPPLVSTNASLTSLLVSPAGSLAPAFAASTFTYFTTNAYGHSPTVTVTNADLTATNRLIYNGATNLLASGAASAPLALTLGVTNVVTVQVTAQDGVTVQTYTVNVVELPSQTKPVPTLSLTSGGLSVSWPADHLGYRLLVQTNHLDLGLSSNPNDWTTLPGSPATTSTNFPILTTNLDGFYKLVYP